MNSGDLTKLRQSSNVSFYYNNLYLQDPEGFLLNRPQNLIQASDKTNLIESRQLGLSLTEQFSTFNTQPLRSLYPPTVSGISGYVTFTYTGAYQTLRISDGASQIQVWMWGAGGGGTPLNVPTGYGGAGAFVSGILPVAGGETLTIIIGRAGDWTSAAGTDAQGGGGGTDRTGGAEAAIGGGRSAIVRNSNDIVVAGGGGGAGERQGSGGFAAWTGTSASGNGIAPGGGGGSQTAGGAGGQGAYSQGLPGTLRFGGRGGLFGGGGGGGYYGGGGGSANLNGERGSGGGGSSLNSNLINATGSNASGTGINASVAPAQSSEFYRNNAAAGGTPTTNRGGDGLIVVALYDPQPFNLRI